MKRDVQQLVKSCDLVKFRQVYQSHMADLSMLRPPVAVRVIELCIDAVVSQYERYITGTSGMTLEQLS